MKTVTALNGDFGVCVSGVTPGDLKSPDFQAQALELWAKHRGLIAVRGDELVDLAPDALVAWAEVFGRVEYERLAAREQNMVGAHPITRIGNTTDKDGNLNAVFAKVPALTCDEDVRYNPETRRPVWHTDSTFKKHPPLGSVFHCKIAPPAGGETLFADTEGAYRSLDDATQARLSNLEAVCSLAHHDKKINSYSPSYPILTPEQRAANPPNRVPIVLNHPSTGRPALYGLNSSTCAIVRRGEPVSDERMDAYDLEGVEDESVLILRELLPMMTSPEFTVRWRWQAGDVVIWDNRSTIHAATGFDHERYQREMWRLTLLTPEQAA